MTMVSRLGARPIILLHMKLSYTQAAQGEAFLVLVLPQDVAVQWRWRSEQPALALWEGLLALS